MSEGPTSQAGAGPATQAGDERRAAWLTRYPRSAVHTDRGIEVGGCSLQALGEQFGTPAYIFCTQTLAANMREFRAAFEDSGRVVDVTFASKALPAAPAFEAAQECGLHVDVSSHGELLLALDAGVDPHRIVVHGNAKEDYEIAAAVEAGVGLIVIDAEDEIEIIEAHARGGQRVLLRVNPAIEAATHPRIATGHAGSKFGLAPDAAQRAISRCRASDRLHLAGLHAHIGSQITSLEGFAKIPQVLASYGDFEVYNLGGGLGVSLHPEQAVPSVAEYAKVVLDAANEFLPSDARVMLEPGRRLVADTIVMVYEVVTVKRGPATTIVAVNGGMSDNLAAAIHPSPRTADMVLRPGGAEAVSLVGKHCESGDVLASQVELDAPRRGDLLAFPSAGAYSYTLANSYNAVRRSPLIAVGSGQARLRIRRDTWQDLLDRVVPDE